MEDKNSYKNKKNEFVLECSNIIKLFGGLVALDNVSFSISKGVIVGVLGPNGAGKTTTMFTIAGILKAHTGSIYLEEEELTNDSAQTIVRKGVALVPENRLMFPQMSVRENLDAGAFTRPSNDTLIEHDILKIFQNALKRKIFQFMII